MGLSYRRKCVISGSFWSRGKWIRVGTYIYGSGSTGLLCIIKLPFFFLIVLIGGRLSCPTNLILALSISRFQNCRQNWQCFCSNSANVHLFSWPTVLKFTNWDASFKILVHAFFLNQLISPCCEYRISLRENIILLREKNWIFGIIHRT